MGGWVDIWMYGVSGCACIGEWVHEYLHRYIVDGNVVRVRGVPFIYTCIHTITVGLDGIGGSRWMGWVGLD